VRTDSRDVAAKAGFWPVLARKGDLMADDATRRARDLVEQLRERGHHAEADKLAHTLSLHSVEEGFLFALREVCETVLTAIEAVDPVMQTMIEELRVTVETRLRLPEEKRLS
jgi:hypothetical protein